MKTMLIASTERWSGKSILSLSLGLAVKEKGLAFSYMKPVSSRVSYGTGVAIDRDVAEIRAVLGLDDDLSDMAPVPLEGAFLREAIESGDLGFLNRVTESFTRLSSHRDLMLIEGRHYLGLGTAAGLSDSDIADRLGADVLLLTRYDGEEAIDRILRALRFLDTDLQPVGVILNEVSMDTEVDVVREEFVPFLADRGAEVMGIIPYDHRLRSVSVDEIVETLGGRLVVDVPQKRPIAHFLIGAMSPESALRGFRRTPELGVITGGDRVDIQIAALEAPSLRCLVLTGNLRPDKSVLNKAEERGIPIVGVGQNTMAAAELCEGLIGRSRIVRSPRLDIAIETTRSNIDVERILEKVSE